MGRGNKYFWRYPVIFLTGKQKTALHRRKIYVTFEPQKNKMLA
jgi:hypothetical protein